MFKITEKFKIALAVVILFFFALASGLLYSTNEVSASKITCRDGSIFNYPAQDYACLNNGGVANVASYDSNLDERGQPINRTSAPKKCSDLAGAQAQACQRACVNTAAATLQSCINFVKQCYEDHGGANSAPLNRCLELAAEGPAQSTGSDELDRWLQRIINLLSAAVGLVIVISLIFAGIQYMTAGSNASQVAAAKNRIGMAILSLILFIFCYTLLQWLVPGGIF